MPRPAISTLFPYTTLFRSQVLQQAGEALLDRVARQRLAVEVALQFEHGAHVLLDGELAEDRRFLRQVRQEIGRATSELQSPYDLVCRLLLEKKKNKKKQ